MNTGKLIGIILGSLLVIALGTFTFFKTHDLLLGTKIKIDSPVSGGTVTKSFIHIKGSAPGASLLTIGGAKVLTDPTGKFDKELLLGLGYNAIEIRSLDHFNREKKVTLEVVYRPGNASSTEEVAIFRK